MTLSQAQQFVVMLCHKIVLDVYEFEFQDYKVELEETSQLFRYRFKNKCALFDLYFMPNPLSNDITIHGTSYNRTYSLQCVNKESISSQFRQIIMDPLVKNSA